MKNKKLIIFLTIIFLFFILSGIIYINKNKQRSPQDTSIDENNLEEKSFVNEEANVKDDNAYIEQMILSQSDMIKLMVNNKEADLSYLGDIINKHSNAYSTIEEKIKAYRENNITIEYLDYYIDKVEKIADNDFKINITSDESININGKNQKNKKTVEIKLKLVDDKGIYEYKEM